MPVIVAMIAAQSTMLTPGEASHDGDEPSPAKPSSLSSTGFSG
jgi:hypothetical protein